jgi:hypothetical protein
MPLGLVTSGGRSEFEQQSSTVPQGKIPKVGGDFGQHDIFQYIVTLQLTIDEVLYQFMFPLSRKSNGRLGCHNLRCSATHVRSASVQIIVSDYSS